MWTYALELARALQQMNVEVHVATQGLPLSRDQRRQVNELSAEPVRARRTALACAAAGGGPLGDIPSLREIWDGAAVFRVTRRSGSTARRAAPADSDRKLRAELAERAERRAHGFGHRLMAERYYLLYRQLAAAPRNAAAAVS